MGRLIAIGDVHGCIRELEDLLVKISPEKADFILMLGDLVNTGPDSRGVLDLVQEIGARSLLGNHERRLLHYHRSGDAAFLKKRDRRTVGFLSKENWSYLENMTLYHYAAEYSTVCVHAGFLPDRPWWVQPPSIVTEIQNIDEFGRPCKRSKSPSSPHWSDLWKGPPFVVYGHTPDLKPRFSEFTLGIDTACVRGGFLTACILPGRELVQVKARKKYA